MSRLLLLLLALLAGALSAAEPAAAAAAAKAQAEQALAAGRERIFKERTAQMQELQNALSEVERRRKRADAARQERDALGAELTRRRADQEREAAALRQEVDRAVAGARLAPAEVRRLSQEAPKTRAAAAAAALEKRAAALAERISLHVGPESVVGRDGSLGEVVVVRLGEARAVALGQDPAHRGYLTRTADGSAWLVGGPELPAGASLGPDGKPVAIPLDPDPAASARAPARRRTLGDWIRAGRIFVWPILAVLFGGLALAIERIVILRRLAVDPLRLADLRRRLDRGEINEVRAAVSGRATPLDRIVAAGLEAARQPEAAREALMEESLLAEAQALQRSLGAILVLAGVAPLLGLLGTVTGMIDLFAVISDKGAAAAQSLSGGISEALVTTQAGLIAAIPLLLIHAVLNRLAERRMLLLEQAAAVAQARGATLAPAREPSAQPATEPMTALETDLAVATAVAAAVAATADAAEPDAAASTNGKVP
jgi:biopolymer transport protein ExbB